MRNVLAAGMIAAALGGCATYPEYDPQYACPPGYAPVQVAPGQAAPGPVAAAPNVPVQPAYPVYSNPIFIPIADPQCAWEAVVDVVDDYFRIQEERPVRWAGDSATDGDLTTFPDVSATVFEPWRRDTVDPAQRVENTLQTMRRFATVHVSPAQGGYMVEVAVFKELEEVVRPEHATAGSATFRYDSTLTGIVNPIGGQRIAENWIPRGRDPSMEQHIIGHLLSRCGPVGQPAGPVVMRGQDR
jgi:hypothetical protein